MKGEQLDIFDQPEAKPMAEIIPFPVDREVMFIRETARTLSIKQGQSADRFWQMTCRRLYARLQVSGIAEQTIRQEINAFSQSVHAEMQRQSRAYRTDDNPKGAA